MYYIILYYIILYYIILYYIILYYLILCYIILYYIILYYIILYYIILCYIILYYIILYYSILYYVICWALSSQRAETTQISFLKTFCPTCAYTGTTQGSIIGNCRSYAVFHVCTVWTLAQQSISELRICGRKQLPISYHLKIRIPDTIASLWIWDHSATVLIIVFRPLQQI